jgi:hypothetical protein
VEVQEVVEKLFVFIQSDWPVSKVIKQIEIFQFTHIIVYHNDQEKLYYLYSCKEIEDTLKGNKDTSSLFEALKLNEHQATPFVDAYVSVKHIPPYPQYIVKKDGYLIGFSDNLNPPLPERSSKKSSRLSGDRTFVETLTFRCPQCNYEWGRIWIGMSVPVCPEHHVLLEQTKQEEHKNADENH